MRTSLRVATTLALALATLPGAARADAPLQAGDAGAQGPAAPAGARTAETPDGPGAQIRHLPVHDVTGTSLRLRFQVRYPERAGTLVVRWRRLGEGRRAPLSETLVRRGPDEWIARLPERAVQPPGLEYWVVERARAGDRAVFASARDPHRVAVFDVDGRERAALRLRGGRRSTVRASGEYVDFGSRRLAGRDQRYPDHYYRLEAGYAYGFFQRVETISVGVGHVRGAAVDLEVLDALAADEPVPTELGIDYGTGAITWYLAELVRLRTSVLFGFSQAGFEYGGGAELVIGRDHATNLSFGGEYVSTLGLTGRSRLEWWTVPRFPMGASIEVSTFPAGSDAGVRLLYDVGVVPYPGALLRVRAGYQARTSVTGSVALGGELALAF